ncbi:TetR/AcrR family transcriptional regulator [Methyloligella sp. 2.7D]|uniref:TetR/AcrR family transcriptional regulator n=1 Tax=unclassified Methyloligella TaxID=2625955 RepID=UPI00157CEEEE|nr:TetR/AcrR family transcriptional regulator [Methyloligella sp. GL2]QKP76245.1 TetR/AcrR family transcriptional regulator [Methyloligella sp. GL2]
MDAELTTSQPLRERNRQLARDAVLDAATRLLQAGPGADFSMRALAAEAGVSFATPFNHFGSKTAIMQALSARVIERMSARFDEANPKGDAIDRVLAMGRISVGLLLEKPDVSKAVVASLGVATPVPSAVRPKSEGLWVQALGDCSGLDPAMRDLGRALLPQQLAFSFRGCLSFWTAGEVSDALLPQAFRAGALTVLLGFADPGRRASMLAEIEPLPVSLPTAP